MHHLELLLCLLAQKLAFASVLKRVVDMNEPLDSHPLEVRSSYNRPVLGCSSEVQYLDLGSHIIHSPNFDRHNPQNYTNDYNCSYILHNKASSGLLRFDCFDFQLEDSDGCSKDRLKVNYGNYRRQYCGEDTPPTVYYKSLGVNFVTDSSGTGTGFLCSVMAKRSTSGTGGLPCGEHRLAAGTYLLQSGNYPGNYGTNSVCGWFLMPKFTRDSMKFSCSSFDMISWDGSCKWDNMLVNGHTFCNTNPPPREDNPLVMDWGAYVRYETPDLPDKVRKGFNCTVVVSAN
ncbi:cubilin-like [Amphibalanus amphitrite]|uniref:cubilin-like n=1 Tax=Amphibalanus amphitrite TaxID=1232801 RepID=UPI001C90BE9A|nr:cubilin-like [Amphibalanus amphitrite]